jgi:signal transduction histidine kinase
VARLLPPAARSAPARAAAIAAAVVVIVLGPVAWGLLDAERRWLDNGYLAAQRGDALRVAALLRDGELPHDLQLSSDASLTQVVDDWGGVVAASPELQAVAPLPQGQPMRADPSVRVARLEALPAVAGGRPAAAAVAPPTPPEGPYLLVTAHAGTARGSWSVHVLGPLAAAEAPMSGLRTGVRLGLPLLALLVGSMTWLLNSRSLRPVEALRSETAEIVRRRLGRRLEGRHARGHTARLAGTMNELLDRLDASAGRQRRFVADASHELRSPLASIQTQLEVALAHPEGTDWVATAHEISGETARMQRVVEDLLLLAQMDEDAVPPRREQVDLDELLLAEARRLHDRGRVAVDASRVSGARVSGDRDQLTRVVRNLVANAERHAVAEVRLELRMLDGEAELVVADDGPGIPPADRERVFERFTRLDEARGRGRGGAGLGLSIARQVVAAHGGAIWVADSGGRPGARLVVRLPRASGSS